MVKSHGWERPAGFLGIGPGIGIISVSVGIKLGDSGCFVLISTWCSLYLSRNMSLLICCALWYDSVSEFLKLAISVLSTDGLGVT